MSFDNFDQYIVVLNYDIVNEQNYINKNVKTIRAIVFEFRVMNVFNSKNRYYIDFLRKMNDDEIFVQIENELKINFDVDVVFSINE